MLKKLFIVFIFCTQWISAQCFNPCDEWYDNCLLRGCSRPGLYIGAHFGHAWIQSPKSGQISFDECDEEEFECESVQGERGDFSWGVFAGFNWCSWIQGLYTGIEAGYHHNGCSSFIFFDSHNRHRLSSCDWDISATFDYVFCGCIDLFFKLGGANVSEKFSTSKKHDEEKLFSGSSNHQWAPVINTGLGYSLYDFLRVTLSYRGVYCQNNQKLKNAFNLNWDNEGFPVLSLKNCSTVHSAYAGLNFTF